MLISAQQLHTLHALRSGAPRVLVHCTHASSRKVVRQGHTGTAVGLLGSRNDVSPELNMHSKGLNTALERRMHCTALMTAEKPQWD